MAGNR